MHSPSKMSCRTGPSGTHLSHKQHWADTFTGGPLGTDRIGKENEAIIWLWHQLKVVMFIWALSLPKPSPQFQWARTGKRCNELTRIELWQLNHKRGIKIACNISTKVQKRKLSTAKWNLWIFKSIQQSCVMLRWGNL